MIKKILAAALAVTALAGCGTMFVQQADLDTWPGVPVEALDTHTVFIAMPVTKTVTDSGIEARNYISGGSGLSCTSMGGQGKALNMPTFTSCSGNKKVCNHIFYIKDSIVLEYAPAGRCITTSSMRPQQRYLDLGKQ
jgi:hypothetical protein